MHSTKDGALPAQATFVGANRVVRLDDVSVPAAWSPANTWRRSYTDIELPMVPLSCSHEGGLMGLKSVRVPDGFEEPFVQAEKYVEELFGGFERKPEEGVIRVGSERYVLMRCESLYGTWFDALAASFGEGAARDFIYNTAREIGRSDSAEFASRLNLAVGVERLATGPVHFAHAGWALVEILEDSQPAADKSYFLHYRHPNTFEAEVLRKRGANVEGCACHFSAGYSAGWCSDAFQLEVHGREIRCTARGDEHCEFIMAASDELDGHQARLLG